jgi:hypothetical protein
MYHGFRFFNLKKEKQGLINNHGKKKKKVEGSS